MNESHDSERYDSDSMGTLYINLEGFEISISIFYLYSEGESGTSRETYERGVRYLKENGIPIESLQGFEKEDYEINE
jgi:hypothetical protein